MIRRIALVVALGLAMSLPGAAVADDEVVDLLQGTMEGDMEGEGIVMSSWQGMSAATVYSLSRSGDMDKVTAGSEEIMFAGSVTASKSGDDWYGIRVSEWSQWTMNDRYSLGPTTVVTRLGRPARQVAIMEGERVRLRLVVDEATAVPLVTEIFDGDGVPYRLAALIQLDQGAAGHDQMPEVHEMETMAPIAPPAAFAASVAGYRRADAYAAPGDMAQVYYSDGLFSFSVFEWVRGATPSEFESASMIVVGEHTYRMRLAPTQMWVFWNAPDRSYVLVGNLPPDHLTAVLSELPRPGDRAWPVRLWRWLFG